MNESEKKYKIQKQTKYYEELSELREESKFATFEFGAAAVASLLGFSFAEKIDHKLFYAIITGFSCINTGIAVYHLKKLIEIISKKTALEVKIDNIKEEFEKERTAFKPKASDLREIDEEIQFKRWK